MKLTLTLYIERKLGELDGHCHFFWQKSKIWLRYFLLVGSPKLRIGGLGPSMSLKAYLLIL